MGEPPDLVKGSYTTDLNIIKIHEAILQRFNFFYDSIPRVEDKIIRLKRKANPEKKTINEIKEIEAEIKELEITLDDYINYKSYNTYINSTKTLLEEYLKVASNKSKGLVILNKGREKESIELIRKRLKIIHEYLEIAKKYIQIEITHNFTVQAVCPGCDTDLSSMFTDEESGLSVCPKCCYERESISHQTTYRDIQRTNTTNKNNYDDCENFRKALYRFQGKQIHHPPNKLYEQLNDYFISIGKPIGSDIKKLPTMPNGKKPGTYRQMMYEALNETNNSAFYDDINLIMHIYWGWELPDISHLEDRIIEDYIATQKVYNEIPDKERDASLNIQFRLFVHLKAVGYPCTKDDFKIQINRDSLIFHTEMWKIMCEKTGLKFHSVI